MNTINLFLWFGVVLLPYAVWSAFGETNESIPRNMVVGTRLVVSGGALVFLLLLHSSASGLLQRVPMFVVVALILTGLTLIVRQLWRDLRSRSLR